MPLHLLKLCVGADTVADLRAWIDARQAERRRAGQAPEHVHVTRMVPKRAAELLDGGSLYWVIRGRLAARQRLLALRPVTGADGIARCEIAMEPAPVEVDPRPCRPFQGWRYLPAAGAPRDLAGPGLADLTELPEPLRRELRDLGLI